MGLRAVISIAIAPRVSSRYETPRKRANVIKTLINYTVCPKYLNSDVDRSSTSSNEH